MSVYAAHKALQKTLGHVFAQVNLLEQALTHRSFSAQHYERLEFLGDAVLSLSISTLLYQRFGHLPEGDLSRIRSHLVKQDTLAGLARKLDLSAHLRLGEGELKSGGRKRPSILADAVEALVGAVYLDAGFDAAQRCVWALYADVSIHPQQADLGKDPKTALQEWLQGRKMSLPVYEVVATHGAAHQQVFEIRCTCTDQPPTVAKGASRRVAEQAAAERMLQQLKDSQP